MIIYKYATVSQGRTEQKSKKVGATSKKKETTTHLDSLLPTTRARYRLYEDPEPKRTRRFLGPCNGRWHGFLMPLDASANDRAEKGEVYTVLLEG